ncbi:response regulator [Thalassotalea sp. LPB0316]|uniref:response regulator n=1 Tax=Thalassotalea sp. LPB0316 TaxID=2769490 RepID=UPI001865B6B6|nr:response regulator [Thalassotalea sp. LPB0316]QOL26655.1 response regulator [Thalassotalea sp. LPB0316]
MLYWLSAIAKVFNLVSKQDKKTRLFQRYNRLVFTVFVLVVLLAIVISVSRYYSAVEEHQVRRFNQFTSNTQLLNQRLKLGISTIDNLSELAQYHLKNHALTLAPLPRLVNDNDGFYLDIIHFDDKTLINNLTGQGRVEELSEPILNEIKMTQQISPAFASAVNTIPEVSWLYYLSNRQFISIYPWVDKEQWRFNQNLLTSEHYAALKQLAQDELYWSKPYIDTAGTGASFSLGAGVYNQSRFMGALVLDFNLNKFADYLARNPVENANVVVINNHQQLMISYPKANINEQKLLGWHEVVPTQLRELTLAQIDQLGPYFKYQGWWVEVVELSANGWSVIQYQPYQHFIAPIIKNSITTFIWSIGTLFVVVLVIYLLTLGSFIRPTKSFVQHIENTAKGDPGKEQPPLGWHYWYQLVENIFGQNRSLMQQLKDHNLELDKRVAEQTSALRAKSEQHQRDFAQLESIVNAIPELIIFTDPKGLIIGVNQAFKKFVGVEDDTFLGERAADMLPKAIAQVLEHFVHLTKQGNDSPSNIRNVEVNEKHFDIYCGYVFGDEKSILGSVFIIRDITQQYASEIALMNAKEHAEEANKAKSQFLANMSHEIRTPINAIDGMMSVLESTSLTPLQLQYITTAQSASSSLLRLVDELLDLAKVESGNMQLYYGNHSLDQIIEQAVQFNLSRAKQKGLDFVIELSPSLPAMVKTDEGRLVQVLNNILNNAVKFTHQGQIKLYVNTYLKSAHQTKTKVRFAISDTGIGIKPEAQKELFNAFTQADESMTREYGGTGLGLAICQQIVKLMGGNIEIKSTLGQGSEFSFELTFEEVSYHPSLDHQIKLVSLNTQMSDNALASINHLGVDVINVERVDDFTCLDSNVVIVIDTQHVDHQKLFEQLADFSRHHRQHWQHVKAIGVLLPSNSNQISAIEQQVMSFKMPYAFIEQPIYRSTLLSLCQLGIEQQEQQANEREKNKVDTNQSLENKSVLLVEDNVVNQMVAKQLLATMGVNVTLAENGQQAVDMVQQQAFDLVLMDIQMPVMDGLTATKKIREQARFSNLPIIAMTAHAREEDRQKSYQAGMNMHIAKPVTAQILKQGMLEALNLSHQVN